MVLYEKFFPCFSYTNMTYEIRLVNKAAVRLEAKSSGVHGQGHEILYNAKLQTGRSSPTLVDAYVPCTCNVSCVLCSMRAHTLARQPM